MKKQILFLFILVFITNWMTAQCDKEIISAPFGLNVSCPPEPYVLVFHDEFDGTELNDTKWATKSGAPQPADRTIWHGCDREQQIYLEDNVTVDNGILKLEAREENFNYTGTYVGNPNVNGDHMTCNNGNTVIHYDNAPFNEEFKFTSGEVLGTQSFSPKNHLFMEIRCKVPKGKGLWPAFWTWHHDEVDVFEYFSTSNDGHFSTNYHSEDGGHCPVDVNGSNLTADFHTYAVEITPWWIKWYFDDSLVRTVSRFYVIGTNPGTPATTMCGQQLPAGLYDRNELFPKMENRWFAPIVNLALHHNYTEEEISNALPAIMEVDYVRVYTRYPEDHPDNQCYFEIEGLNEGQDQICSGQEYVFTWNSNVPFNDINWSTTNNLEIINITSNHIVVMANTSNTENGTITAEIPSISDYCSNTIFTFDLTIHPNENFDILELIPACYNPYGHGNHHWSGTYITSPPTNVQWSINYGTVSPTFGDYTRVYPNSVGYFTLTATAETLCGDEVTVSRHFYADECGFGKFLELHISPNPASDIMQVQIENTFEEPGSFEYTISNLYSEIIFEGTSSDDFLQLDVSNYQNGVYHLQVIRDGSYLAKTFIVNHE